MIKFLLIIMLMVSGLKLIADNTFAFKSCIIELAFPDNENNGDDSEEGEQEKSKSDSEDELHFKYPAYHPEFNGTITLLSSLQNHRPYSGYNDKPYTPPDLTRLFSRLYTK